MTQGAAPELSVVIPAFNEARRLGASLERIVDYLSTREASWEVIVVDDGSGDATLEIARSHPDERIRALRLERNMGKGAAVRHGVLASRGARVLISDADLSTPIEELPRLEARLAEAPLVLGSRARPDSRVVRHQALYRELMGKTFNKILRLAGIRGVDDTQCGFKLLEGDLARELFGRIVSRGFAFDAELVWLARRTGCSLVEVGVEWHNSPDSRVRPLIDPPKMLLEVVVFRWRHRRLKPGALAPSRGLPPTGPR